MMEEPDRLIEAYIENDLQDVDRQALCQWLEQDRSHVRRFIRDCFLHWQLFAIGRRKSVQNDVNEMPRPPGLAGLSSTLAVGHPRTSARGARNFARFKAPVRAALAAASALACGLGIWLGTRLSRPETVAQLTQATPDVAWVDSSAGPATGAFLHEGEWLQLDRGRALATLSSGVQIVMQGPATIRIEAGNMMFLQTGRVTILVPRQASGFIVESPLARFVDLGTEFTLAVESSGCELHVFSGLVEMQPKDSRRTDQLRVPEGRAIRYSVPNGSMTTLPYDRENRISI